MSANQKKVAQDKFTTGAGSEGGNRKPGTCVHIPLLHWGHGSGWGHGCPLLVRTASFRKSPTLAPVTQVIKVIHFSVSKASKQHIQSVMGQREEHTLSSPLLQLWCHKEASQELNCSLTFAGHLNVLQTHKPSPLALDRRFLYIICSCAMWELFSTELSQ